MKRAIWSLLALLGSGAWAQSDRHVADSEAYYQRPLDALMQTQTQLKAEVGSRAGQRDALEATVPIDVITAEQLRSDGSADLGAVLSRLIAGLNLPRPSIADGTDHAPPLTLRGLNPDQVLVLVNGRRQHQTSLLHNNGTIGRGSSGVDLSTLPIALIERVEVLRDGAAAQYGSDAIAGIINIILKGFGAHSNANVRYGSTHAGDGVLKQVDVLHSLALPEDGFINLAAERRERAATNRALPDAANGGRMTTHFGDPDTQDSLLALNAELPRGDITAYVHGALDHRRSQAGAFFRGADDERNLPGRYPQGFLPVIAPHIDDASLSAGVRGLNARGLQWDASYSHGRNDYHFYVLNSLNRSLGDRSPASFDSGATHYSQHIFNLDLRQKLGQHHLAGGVEWRQERYRIARGEPASYQLGPESAWYPGAQGFGGFQPDNEVDARRHSLAAYLDAQVALRPGLTLDAAARAERFSDFGSTLDGKLALRLRPSDSWLLRGSVSTGFRAPSLSQSHFTSTATIRDGNELLQYGNLGVDHPVARALGATDLQAETSQHLTLGLVFQPSSALTLSADWFLTAIDDRILPTAYISAWSLGSLSPQAIEVLRQAHVDGVVFFTNALNTRTHGLDLRLDHQRALPGGLGLKLTAAYQRSSTRIHSSNAAPPVLGVTMNELVLDAFTRVTIEQGQPKDRLALWAKLQATGWCLSANLNRFGSYYSTAASTPVRFAAQWTLDTQWEASLGAGLRLALGATNLFNSRPAEWGATDDSVFGSGKIVPYSQYAPQGYNGRFVYARLTLDF